MAFTNGQTVVQVLPTAITGTVDGFGFDPVNCAVVQGILVVNMIVAEPTDTPPDNCTLVLVPPDLFVNIGYTYQDPNFYDFAGSIVMPYQEVTNGK